MEGGADDAKLAARVKELENELANAHASLAKAQEARDEARAQAAGTSERLADSQRAASALHAKLRRLRHTIASPSHTTDDIHRSLRDAVEEADEARALLAALATGVHQLVGKRAVMQRRQQGGLHASVSKDAPLGPEHVHDALELVRTALDQARAEASRQSARADKALLALKHKQARRHARALGVAAGGEGAAGGGAEGGASEFELATLRSELRAAKQACAAMQQSEQRTHAETVSLRTALAAAHSELARQRPSMPPPGPFVAKVPRPSSGAAAPPKPALVAQHGWELVQLVPSLEPGPSAAELPDRLVAHVRGALYSLERVRARQHVGRAFESALGEASASQLRSRQVRPPRSASAARAHRLRSPPQARPLTSGAAPRGRHRVACLGLDGAMASASGVDTTSYTGSSMEGKDEIIRSPEHARAFATQAMQTQRERVAAGITQLWSGGTP